MSNMMNLMSLGRGTGMRGVVTTGECLRVCAIVGNMASGTVVVVVVVVVTMVMMIWVIRVAAMASSGV